MVKAKIKPKKKTIKKSPAKSKELITKNMPIGDVVSKYPQTVPVFGQHGLHCIGCAIASFESVEQGANAHGIDVNALLKDLNATAKKKKTTLHEECSCCGN
jgi:hybrid cluster-associated redox disulfide protein